MRSALVWFTFSSFWFCVGFAGAVPRYLRMPLLTSAPFSPFAAVCCAERPPTSSVAFSFQLAVPPDVLRWFGSYAIRSRFTYSVLLHRSPQPFGCATPLSRRCFRTFPSAFSFRYPPVRAPAIRVGCFTGHQRAGDGDTPMTRSAVFACVRYANNTISSRRFCIRARRRFQLAM